MCGITGILNLQGDQPIEERMLRMMLATVQHRGPDEFGIYLSDTVGLGSARLSIIDLSSGQQPIGNEDSSLWIVFNGEIFNYVDLRPTLEAKGHKFTTNTDTEVVLHLYEEYGPECLGLLNGQFALAIWDSRKKRLFLARDRLGIRPLFYTQQNGQLVFGSEIKAIFSNSRVSRSIDTSALGQVFTYWSVMQPSTIFKDLKSLPAGHYMLAENGNTRIEPYWENEYGEELPGLKSSTDYLNAFEKLMVDAALIRLRADVPVGAYLSGGIDSSIITALINKYTTNRLETFSIAFSDPKYDESQHQKKMAAYLGTEHRVVYCTQEDIGRNFPSLIWHTETPVLRTSPVPMFMLSKLVNEHGLKVVLTGEGADEILAGYNIFKEMRIRRFWAKDPDSEIRPLLLRRLYPDITALSQTSDAYLRAFFKRNLDNTASPYYSHSLRWANTARTTRFLLDPPGNHLEGLEKLVPLPEQFQSWHPLIKAQYLEVAAFLTPYLLSSQGDRPAMAHSVEGRFPFLDHRVVSFCNHLPPHLKLVGLKEKWLLKQLGKKLLPAEIWQRPKRPYRAPIQRSFYHKNTPDYVDYLLDETMLQAYGLFKSDRVQHLTRKAKSETTLTEIEEMALVGILSSQLVYNQFVQDYQPRKLETKAPLKIVRGKAGR